MNSLFDKNKGFIMKISLTRFSGLHSFKAQRGEITPQQLREKVGALSKEFNVPARVICRDTGNLAEVSEFWT